MYQAFFQYTCKCIKFDKLSERKACNIRRTFLPCIYSNCNNFFFVYNLVGHQKDRLPNHPFLFVFFFNINAILRKHNKQQMYIMSSWIMILLILSLNCTCTSNKEWDFFLFLSIGSQFLFAVLLWLIKKPNEDVVIIVTCLQIDHRESPVYCCYPSSVRKKKKCLTFELCF